MALLWVICTMICNFVQTTVHLEDFADAAFVSEQAFIWLSKIARFLVILAVNFCSIISQNNYWRDASNLTHFHIRTIAWETQTLSQGGGGRAWSSLSTNLRSTHGRAFSSSCSGSSSHVVTSPKLFFAPVLGELIRCCIFTVAKISFSTSLWYKWTVNQGTRQFSDTNRNIKSLCTADIKSEV